MEITLPPEWEKRIADKVAGGEYPSPDEVVREGLRRLFAEEEHLAALRTRIQEGVGALDRGEAMDGDEFFAELDGYLGELAVRRP